jgi:hypothetical protein
MTMKCVNGIHLDRLRATRDLIEADADGPLANPNMSRLFEIRLDAGRIATKIGK